MQKKVTSATKILSLLVTVKPEKLWSKFATFIFSSLDLTSFENQLCVSVAETFALLPLVVRISLKFVNLNRNPTWFKFF